MLEMICKTYDDDASSYTINWIRLQVIPLAMGRVLKFVTGKMLS